MKPLLSGRARNIRLEMITAMASGDVLNIGCGRTGLPDMLPDLTSYTGLDINQGIIEQCRIDYPQHEFYCLNLDRDSLPFEGRQFDTLIMTAVIEHLNEPARVLRQVRPLLADGGLFLVTTPSPLGDVVHQIGSRLKLFYPESVVGHVKIFGKRELCALLVECGFEIELYQRFLLGMNQFVVGRPADCRPL